MSVPDGLHGAYLLTPMRVRIGRYPVARRIGSGELRQLWPGVVAESGRVLDLRTRAAAALLINGEDAVVAGPTAARLHGCDAINSELVHILRPYGPGIRRRPGLALHRGAISPEDVVDIDGLPVLVLDRVVCEVLCTERPRDALAVTDQALARQLDEHAAAEFRLRVGARLRARADARGTRRAVGLLELATGRAESPPESWLRLMLVERGYPTPEANWSVRGPDGAELYRLDLAWPSLRIAVEYDGYAAHFGREAVDQRRRDDLRRRGWIVVVATVDDLTDSTRLERELVEAFGRRGAPVR
jgi:hypothetical protein